MLAKRKITITGHGMKNKSFMAHKSFKLALLCLAVSEPLLGATYNVTTNADSGAGSLRAALQSSLTSADATDTINFNSGLSPIVLQSPLPIISTTGAGPKTVNINTASPEAVTINGNGYQGFVATTDSTAGSLTVNLNGIAMENCKSTGGAGGGGTGTGMGGGGGLGAGGALFVGIDTTVTITNMTFCSACSFSYLQCSFISSASYCNDTQTCCRS